MGESNVIEMYVRYLRLKIEDEEQKQLIQTIAGVGYVLREGKERPRGKKARGKQEEAILRGIKLRCLPLHDC